MTTAYSSLLGLALPVEGELDGQWGDVVNNATTQYLDIAIAGTQVLATDADATLTRTFGSDTLTNIGATTSQYAIIRWTASNGATTRNINVPNLSKTYVVINAGTGSVVLRGVTGPTTGITIIAGENCVAAWNGSDFVKISSSTALAGVVPIASGGTGQTVASAAYAAFTGYASRNGQGITTTFTNASPVYQVFTGTGLSTSVVQLPVTSTLAVGWTFFIRNDSIVNVLIRSSGSNLVATLAAGYSAMVTCVATGGTTDTDWKFGFTNFTTTTGTGALVLGSTPTLSRPNITNELTLTGTAGTAGQALLSQGSGNAPIWGSGGITAGKSIALAMIFGF